MPTISLFKTIQPVLDQALQDACLALGTNEKKVLTRVREHLRANQQAYFGGGQVNLPYGDPLCRLAYLYVFVAANAYLFEKALDSFAETKSLVETVTDADPPLLHVCSLGGGPGSELLGMVRRLQRSISAGESVSVDFCLVDRVPEWDETWQALVRSVQAGFRAQYGRSRRDWPVTITQSFLTLDLTEPNSLRGFTSRFADVDLFVLNYVVSELSGREAQLGSWLRELAKRSREEALFLIVDRNESRMKGCVQGLCSEAKLATPSVKTLECSLPGEERKEDLGRCWNSLDWSPKLKAKAIFLLSGKEETPPF